MSERNTMEQEKSMYQLKNTGKLTGEMLVKALLLFFEKGEGVMDLVKNRPVRGEQKWNRFMATEARKEVKEFRTTEINLEQLRDILKLYNIGFSIKSLEEDGTTLLSFEARNRAVMEQAFEKVLDRAINPESAVQFGKVLSSQENRKPFEERLAAASKQSQELEAIQEAKNAVVSKGTQKVDEVVKS